MQLKPTWYLVFSKRFIDFIFNQLAQFHSKVLKWHIYILDKSAANKWRCCLDMTGIVRAGSGLFITEPRSGELSGACAGPGPGPGLLLVVTPGPGLPLAVTPGTISSVSSPGLAHAIQSHRQQIDQTTDSCIPNCYLLMFYASANNIQQHKIKVLRAYFPSCYSGCVKIKRLGRLSSGSQPLAELLGWLGWLSESCFSRLIVYCFQNVLTLRLGVARRFWGAGPGCFKMQLRAVMMWKRGGGKRIIY